MNIDHNYLSIVTTLVLLALAFIGYMGRGWIRHVNDNLKEINAGLKDLDKDREERWLKQKVECGSHLERIAFLEAKINGRGMK